MREHNRSLVSMASCQTAATADHILENDMPNTFDALVTGLIGSLVNGRGLLKPTLIRTTRAASRHELVGLCLMACFVGSSASQLLVHATRGSEAPLCKGRCRILIW